MHHYGNDANPPKCDSHMFPDMTCCFGCIDRFLSTKTFILVIIKICLKTHPDTEDKQPAWTSCLAHSSSWHFVALLDGMSAFRPFWLSQPKHKFGLLIET